MQSAFEHFLKNEELNSVTVGWLVLFNIPSTARSFREGPPFIVP